MSEQTHHLNAFATLRIGLGALILGVLLTVAGPAQPAAAVLRRPNHRPYRGGS